MAPSTADPGQIAFRDDFSADALDLSTWRLPEGLGSFYGRSQVRSPSDPPRASGGLLGLAIDTFNPTALVPGDSFLSSEIVSRRTFTVGRGVIVRARVRVNVGTPPGVVAALFFYGTDNQLHDEIDTELPTKLMASGQLLTNYFVASPFTSAGQPVLASGISLGVFTELEIDWLPTTTAWKVDGRTVREMPTPSFSFPMAVHLNFWVPDPAFAAAYDGTLQPANNARDNKTYRFDIDFVEVRTLTSLSENRGI
jgi:beta-glucanase (GH16 family)